jgi:hypothetical protein
MAAVAATAQPTYDNNAPTSGSQNLYGDNDFGFENKPTGDENYLETQPEEETVNARDEASIYD